MSQPGPCRDDARRRRGRAFTLVELLVVIGIIAVLIGLLLPSLSRARESAKRVKCLSNLRSLATSLILYADGSKGWLPNMNPLNTVNDDNAATEVLVALNREFIKSPGVFHCPSDEDPEPQDIVTADYNAPNSARVSYDFYSVWWEPENGPKLVRVKDAPLVWDLDGGRPLIRYQNHGRTGGNVAYSDGHADWQWQAEWDAPNWPNPAKKYYPKGNSGG
jgi:prepilin-type N-terminal cleavage/methylation domain-containing protein/prepilin-type processing-associated H-X9-DG protein